MIVQRGKTLSSIKEFFSDNYCWMNTIYLPIKVLFQPHLGLHYYICHVQFLKPQKDFMTTRQKWHMVVLMGLLFNVTQLCAVNQCTHNPCTPVIIIVKLLFPIPFPNNFFSSLWYNILPFYDAFLLKMIMKANKLMSKTKQVGVPLLDLNLIKLLMWTLSIDSNSLT